VHAAGDAAAGLRRAAARCHAGQTLATVTDRDTLLGLLDKALE
jgi:hypothetical protein